MLGYWRRTAGSGYPMYLELIPLDLDHKWTDDWYWNESEMDLSLRRRAIDGDDTFVLACISEYLVALSFSYKEIRGGMSSSSTRRT